MSSPRSYSIAFALAALLGAVYAGEVQSTTPPPPPPAPSKPANSAAGEADAAKHLKRTECLRDARTRKLVGAQRTAFVKDCLEGPGAGR